MRRVFICLLLLASCSLAQAKDMSERARHHLREGRRLYAAGRFDKAMKSFGMAAEMAQFGFEDTTTLREALNMGVECALRAGDGNKAAELAKHRIEFLRRRGPAEQIPVARLQLAEAYLQGGRTTLAGKLIKELKADPNLPAGLQHRLKALEEEIGGGDASGGTTHKTVEPPQGIRYHVIEPATEEPELEPAPATPPAPSAPTAAATQQAAAVPLPAPAPAPAATPVTARPPPQQPPARRVEITTTPPSAAPQASKPSMVLIPAGSFLQGDPEGAQDERTTRQVHLSAFLLDATEVTNRSFAAFVTGSGHRPLGDWRLHYDSDTGHQLPVRGVAWADADAYCRWAAKRLPTEAEWEYAARGPEARRYAYGNEFDRRASCSGRLLTDGPCPVGSHRPNAFGVHDLTGNALEWVNDWYAREAYYSGEVTDPTGPETGKRRVLRGGSFDDDASASRAANRFANRPGGHLLYYGFRCAKDAD